VLVTSQHEEIAQQYGLQNPLELWACRFSHLLKKKVSRDHRTIYQALYDLISGKLRPARLAILGYRAMAKTTLSGPIFMPWLICETDLPEIHLISQSGGAAGLSTKIMHQIRMELDDPVMIEDYGYVKGSQWTNEHIEVKRADESVCNLYSRGKRSTIRGQRGMVLFEDIQDVDDVDSETILARDEEWFFGDALNVPGPDDPVVFISNYLSPVSLAAKVAALPGWTVLRFYAEDPPHSGRSSWPAMYSDEYLAMKRAELGRDRYNAEYLLEPRVSGNPVFLPEWYRFYSSDDEDYKSLLVNERRTTVGFDGADSTSEAADETAIVSFSSRADQTDPDIYVREVFGGNVSQKNGVAHLFGVKDRMGAHEVVVESRVKQGNMGPVEEEIKEYERINRASLGATIVRPDRDKVTRALYVQGIVERGKVKFNPNDPQHQLLMTQLTMFTGTGKFHDDRVDAFVHGLTRHLDWIGRKVEKPAVRTLPSRLHIDKRTGMVV